MADQHTGADSVRLHLTGAAYDGAWQDDHALSLGNYRAYNILESLTPIRFYPIAGIAVLYASGANGEGIGSLSADTAGTLRWTPPGATQGVSVAVANGETKVVAGDDVNRYVLVYRFLADDLSGTETIQLLSTYNNAVGGPDFAAAETAAGEEKYSGLMLRNGGSVSATGLVVWIDPDCASGVRIAKEAPSSNALQNMATATAQPTGLTWVSPTTEGAGLSIGTLAVGALYGLRIERAVTAGSSANARVKVAVYYSFTVSGTKYTRREEGLYRIANASAEAHGFWIGTDSEPDLNGAFTAESALNSALESSVLTPGHTYYWAYGQRNRHGLASPVESLSTLILDSGGVASEALPSPPATVQGQAGTDGKLKLAATYQPAMDETDRADTWLVYVNTDGTDPDPDTDSPTTVAMDLVEGLELLAWESSANIDQTPYRWLVRTRRAGIRSILAITRSSTTATVYCHNHGLSNGDSVVISGASQTAYNGTFTATVVTDQIFTYSVAGSPTTPATGTLTMSKATTFDSANTLVGSNTGSLDGPPKPVGRVAFGRAAGIAQTPDAFGSDVTTYINLAANARLVQSAGSTKLYVGATLCFELKYNSVATDRNGFYTAFALRDADVSGAAAAVSEYVAGPPVLVYLSVNGTRRLKVDVTNSTLTVMALDDSGSGQLSRQDAPAHGRYADTCLQVWDPGAQDWATAAKLESDGTLVLWVPFRDYAAT